MVRRFNNEYSNYTAAVNEDVLGVNVDSQLVSGYSGGLMDCGSAGLDAVSDKNDFQFPVERTVANKIQLIDGTKVKLQMFTDGTHYLSSI